VTQEPKYTHKSWGITLKIGPFTKDEWDRMAEFNRDMAQLLEGVEDELHTQFILPDHLMSKDET
jgi:hypothetical protein